MYNSTPLNGLPHRNNCGGYFEQTISPRRPSGGTPCFVNISKDGPLVTPKKLANTPIRRYSLSSDVSCISPPRHNSKLPNGILTSTQIDARSPGYAGRLVRYNEERERAMPTHQPKYQGVGIFPIVHMFKKDLPISKRKPHHKINTPNLDLSRYNSPEHNRMLLEKIVQPNPFNNKMTTPLRPLSNSEVSTRSVLDALKEISRKRIHASEETYDFTTFDDGKRIRLEEIENNKKKRSRGESPPTDGIQVSPIKKKVCSSSLDELQASYTSSTPEATCELVAKKTDKAAISNLVVLGEKDRKGVDAETQTQFVVETKDSESNTINDKVLQSGDVTMRESLPKLVEPPPVKIFDDGILEVKRKNRLAVLMGMFVDKDKSSDHGETLSPGKNLVSILADPHQKNVPKSSTIDKHVSFNLPSTNQDSMTSKDNSNLGSPVNSITTTSVAVVTPITTPTVLPTAENSIIKNVGIEPPTPSTSPVSGAVGGELAPLAPPAFAFKTNPTPSTSSETVNAAVPNFNFSSPTGKAATTTPTTTIESKTASTSAGFTFGVYPSGSMARFGGDKITPVVQTSTSVSSIELPKSLTATSNLIPNDPRLGGFKFNLTGASATIATTTPSTTPKYSFGGSATISPVTTTSSNPTMKSGSTPNFGFTSNMNQKTTGFGSTPTTLVVTTNSFRLGGSSFTSAPSTTTSAAIGLSSTGPAFNFGTSVTPAATVATVPNNSNVFGSVTNGHNDVTGKSGGSSALNLSNPPPNFGVSSRPASTALPTFGAPQTSNIFGSSTATVTAPIFGAFSTPPPAVATASSLQTKEKIFSFGAANQVVTTTSAAVSNPPSMFSTNNNNNPKPMFGNNATGPVFGVATTTAPSTPFAQTNIFNSSAAATAKSFGTPSAGTSAPGFNFTGGLQNNTQQQQSSTAFNLNKPIFGAANTNTSSPFGTTTAVTTANNGATFGTQAPPPAFGTNSFAAPPPTTTAPPAFGGAAPNSNQVMGSNKLQETGGFYSNTSFNFGGSGNIFGGAAATTTATTTPSFGSSSVTTSSGFGSAPLASSAGFGSGSGGGNVFGNGNPPSSDFRSSTAVTNNAPSAFGTSGNTFGANQSSFGNAAPTGNGFGFNSSNASFGNNNSFGQQPLSSGPPNQTVGGGGAFNFGNAAPPSTNNNNNQAPVFSFGSSEPPRANFNFSSNAPPAGGFGATGGNNNALQSSSSSAFGGFGAVPLPALTPQFGAPSVAGAPGMFNIGSGATSTPGRARTQLRAKRRT